MKKRMVWIGMVALVIVAGLMILFARYRYLVLSQLNLNLPNQDSAAVLGLKKIADLPLPGGTTRFDYQSIDESRGLLFIAHLGADQVIVFDLKTQTVVATIPNIASAHGVIAVPELGRVYAAATSTPEVVVIDEPTFQVVARMGAGM